MSTNRRALLLAVAVLATANCTGAPARKASPPEPSLPPPPTEVGSVPIEPEPTDIEDPGGPVPNEATDEDLTAATNAATATMEIWVQGSTLEERQWREQLDATLTTTGQEATSTIWGYRIRDTEVTGAPEIVRANAASAVLRVTTNYTSYEVTVVKTNDGPWLTSNLTTDSTEGAEQ